MVMGRLKINEKEAGDGPFFLKKQQQQLDKIYFMELSLGMIKGSLILALNFGCSFLLYD